MRRYIGLFVLAAVMAVAMLGITTPATGADQSDPQAVLAKWNASLKYDTNTNINLWKPVELVTAVLVAPLQMVGGHPMAPPTEAELCEEKLENNGIGQSEPYGWYCADFPRVPAGALPLFGGRHYGADANDTNPSDKYNNLKR